MSFTDPLSDVDKAKVKSLIDAVKALTDQEYYWFHDALSDLPEVEMCCLRRTSDFNCSCNDYDTRMD